MANESTTCNVFAYGTLKTGHCREIFWPCSPRETTNGWIRASLYDTGPYPAIIEGNDWVAGQLRLFEPADIGRVLNALDTQEEYLSPGNPINLYERQIVQCETVDGRIFQAFAYYYARRHQIPTFRRLLPVHSRSGRLCSIWPDGEQW